MCQNTEIEMNQTHRVNFFFKEGARYMTGWVSPDTGMSTNYPESLRHVKVEQLWGVGTE